MRARNQHACLRRSGKEFVPLGANLLGGSRHRFDRVAGGLGEQGVRTVHVDQIFRARIVAERSVLGFQREVVPVERIDGAAKRGTKSALLSCTFLGWRACRRLVIACVRVQERERDCSYLLFRKRTTSAATFFFGSKNASLLAVKTYFRLPVAKRIWVLSAATRTWDMNQVSSLTKGLADLAFSAAVFHFNLGILGAKAGDDMGDDDDDMLRCWFRQGCCVQTATHCCRRRP